MDGSHWFWGWKAWNGRWLVQHGALGASPTNPSFGCIFRDYWHVKSIVNNLVVYAETEDLFPNISISYLALNTPVIHGGSDQANVFSFEVSVPKPVLGQSADTLANALVYIPIYRLYVHVTQGLICPTEALRTQKW